MKVLDVIKKLFKKLKKEEQTPLLTDGKTQIIPQDNFKNKYKFSQLELPKEPSLESCFEEYISQYSLQEEINPNTLTANKSYKAFRRMFCGAEEEIGDNLQNQLKLEKLLKKQGYSLAHQIDPKGKYAFTHIQGQERNRIQ